MTDGALRLRETPKPGWLRQTRDETDAPESGTGAAGVRCAACGAYLASAADAFEYAGGHRHRLTNPADVTFEVLIYRAAEGCARRGPAVREHSWFPPASWTLATCRACGVQVGWFFDGAETPFVGLIAQRVRMEASGAQH